MADVIKIYQRLKQDLTQLVAWVRANYLGKVQNPTAGHFAGVDSTGNVVDSGYGSSSFQTPLASQTAYNRKGSASAVPQITTNALGQVTEITEVPIDIPASQVQTDWQENDATSVRHIQNRTHYVESVSYTDKWNQSNVEVGSGSSSPGAYSGTFTLTAGNKYRVIITNGNNSKTYTDIEAVYDSTLNGNLLNKNWSNPMYGAEAQSDAFYILVQSSSIVLASVDVYGSNCTVQVSEITENVKKLDPKYLPDNVNQLESITTQESSVSGGTNVVTFTQSNGTQTSFNVKNGEKGDTGATGPQGATGPTGPQGPKGDDGVSLGEIALTQEVTQDTDKVPSDKAVYDGMIGATIVGTGFEAQGYNGFAQLNSKQVAWLNASETMTLFVSEFIRGTSNVNLRQYHIYFRSNDTSGVTISFDYSRNLIINGNASDASVSGGVNLGNFIRLSCCVEINRVEGWAKLWSEGQLLANKTDDAIKKSKFVGDDGIFKLSNSGGLSHKGCYYMNYAIFAGSIMTTYNVSDFSATKKYLPSYSLSHPFSLSNMTATQGSVRYYNGNADTTTTGSGFIVFTRNQGSTKTGAWLGQTDEIANTIQPYARYSYTPFDVISGYMVGYTNKQGFAGDGSAKICYRDANGLPGNEISDYTNIGVGEYIFIAWPPLNSRGGGMYLNWGDTSNNAVSIKVYLKTLYYNIGCICNIKCDTLYNGNLYDTIGEQVFPIYTTNALATKKVIQLTDADPEKIGEKNSFGTNIWNTYNGYVLVDGTNVYIYVKDGTSLVKKQINNS